MSEKRARLIALYLLYITVFIQIFIIGWSWAIATLIFACIFIGVLLNISFREEFTDSDDE